MFEDVTPVGPLAGAPPWLLEGLKDRGVTEAAGAADNPIIVQYHASTDGGPAPDSVPWCSSWLCDVFRRCQIPSTRSKAAASWCYWGKPCGLELGAIVVLHKAQDESSPHSGNHVGILVSHDERGMRLLSGNSGNTVRVSYYNFDDGWKIKALRWPASV